MLAIGLLDTRQVLVRDAAAPRPAAPVISIAPAWFGPGLPGVSVSLVLDGQRASPAPPASGTE